MSKLGPGGLFELLRVPTGQRHPTFDPNPSSPYGSGQVPGTPTSFYSPPIHTGLPGSPWDGIPHVGISGVCGPWNQVTPNRGVEPIIPSVPTGPNAPPATIVSSDGS